MVGCGPRNSKTDGTRYSGIFLTKNLILINIDNLVKSQTYQISIYQPIEIIKCEI